MTCLATSQPAPREQPGSPQTSQPLPTRSLWFRKVLQRPALVPTAESASAQIVLSGLGRSVLAHASLSVPTALRSNSCSTSGAALLPV